MIEIELNSLTKTKTQLDYGIKIEFNYIMWLVYNAYVNKLTKYYCSLISTDVLRRKRVCNLNNYEKIFLQIFWSREIAYTSLSHLNTIEHENKKNPKERSHKTKIGVMKYLCFWRTQTH